MLCSALCPFYREERAELENMIVVFLVLLTFVLNMITLSKM